MTNRDEAEERGYTKPCRGCGQITDTGWCGCQAGEEPKAPKPNTFYCQNCDTACSEVCRDCGQPADEICGRCEETVENCGCET